jgi:hypothetical protein
MHVAYFAGFSDQSSLRFAKEGEHGGYSPVNLRLFAQAGSGLPATS